MSKAEAARVDFRGVLESLSDAVYVIGIDNRIAFWNRMAEQISGYRAEEVTGKLCSQQALHHVDLCGAEICSSECPARSCMHDGQRREMVTYLRHRDGHRVPVQIRISPILRGDEVIAVVGQFNDLTPQTTRDAGAECGEVPDWMDKATALPSLTASVAQLRQAMENWNMTGDRFSVAVIAPENMEAIEKQYGSETRKHLLVALGRTLQGIVRQSDYVGRWLGDQFIVILVHCGLRQAREICRRAKVLGEKTFVTHEKDYVGTRLTTSAAMVREDDDPSLLLQRAGQELEAAHAAAPQYEPGSDNASLPPACAES